MGQTLERNVALRILPPALAGNRQRWRRFILEATSASSLDHPNIVAIHETASDRMRGSDCFSPGHRCLEDGASASPSTGGHSARDASAVRSSNHTPAPGGPGALPAIRSR
jgi:hypothetical protein